MEIRNIHTLLTYLTLSHHADFTTIFLSTQSTHTKDISYWNLSQHTKKGKTFRQPIETCTQDVQGVAEIHAQAQT